MVVARPLHCRACSCRRSVVPPCRRAGVLPGVKLSSKISDMQGKGGVWLRCEMKGRTKKTPVFVYCGYRSVKRKEKEAGAAAGLSTGGGFR